MATAKVIIAGQNNIGSAVKGAKTDILGFGEAAQKVGDTLKKAFTITAIVASLKKLSDACASCEYSGHVSITNPVIGNQSSD